MRLTIQYTVIGRSLFAVAALGLMAGYGGPSQSSNNNNSRTKAPCWQHGIHTDKGALYRVPVVAGPDPIRLVDQLDATWHITVDHGTLYFTDKGTGNCTGNFKKLNVDASPKTAPEVLVSGLNNPKASRIYNGYLYFTEFGNNAAVSRVNLNTGVTATLVDGLDRPFGVAVGSEGTDIWVYFAEVGDGSNGTVKRFRVGSDGSITGVETLAENLKMPVGLDVDASYVYVVEMNGGRVLRMARNFSGTSLPTQEDLMINLSTPYPPALEGPNDGTNTLYFADFNAGVLHAGKIYKLSGVDADGPIIPLTPDDCGGLGAPLSCTLLAESLSWPMQVAVDEDNVYWSEVWSASVKGIAKDGDPATLIELANGTDHGIMKPHGIATDGVHVYFTDLGDGPCCFGGPEP